MLTAILFYIYLAILLGIVIWMIVNARKNKKLENPKKIMPQNIVILLLLFTFRFFTFNSDFIESSKYIKPQIYKDINSSVFLYIERFPKIDLIVTIVLINIFMKLAFYFQQKL